MAGGKSATVRQGGADGRGDGFSDAMTIVEANFLFGRVDIHVEAVRIHIDEEKRYRVLTLHEGGVVTFAKTIGDGWALDRSSVQKGELHLAGGPAEASATDVSPDSHSIAIGGRDFDEACREFSADEASDTFRQVLGGR